MSNIDVPKGWKLAAAHWGDAEQRREDVRGSRVVGLLLWNDSEGEGEVLFSPDLINGDRLSKLDALSDWEGLLGKDYNHTLHGPSDE